VVKPVDRRCRSLVAVLLTSLATLVVAGCGGDDGKPSASATEPIVRTLRAGGLTL
jgi:hypothetical protein